MSALCSFPRRTEDQAIEDHSKRANNGRQKGPYKTARIVEVGERSDVMERLTAGKIGVGRPLAGLLASLMALSACAPFTQYRTDYQLCDDLTLGFAKECETHSLQQLPAADGASYLLGFVEFDDQGQIWDRKQMWAVIDKLNAEAAEKDLLMVVFAHGWKHSAAAGDGNIETFRKVLARLSEDELHISRKTGLPARRLGGVSEVLSRMELVKRDKDSTVPGGSGTRLAVIGHSFGGAEVYTSLAQILQSRFVRTTGPSGQQSNIEGFGNLVVLINPAFEASLFTPLSDMSTERGTYFASQLPVMAILTSEAAYATRYAFPAGRFI